MSTLMFETPENQLENIKREYQEGGNYLVVIKDLICNEGTLEAGSIVKIDSCYVSTKNNRNCKLKLVDIDFNGKIEEKDKLTVEMPITELDCYFRIDKSISKRLKAIDFLNDDCITPSVKAYAVIITAYFIVVFIAAALIGKPIGLPEYLIFYSIFVIPSYLYLLISAILRRKVLPHFIRKDINFWAGLQQDWAKKDIVANLKNENARLVEELKEAEQQVEHLHSIMIAGRGRGRKRIAPIEDNESEEQSM